MTASRWLFTALAFLFALPCQAQEVASGPAAGDKVPALKVFAATGDHENKEIDFPAERKDKPTIYIFIQSEHWNRPVARFVKTLDTAVAKDHADAHLVAVWLTEKPDDAKEYLPKAQKSLNLGATSLTVFPDEKKEPENWGINSMAHVTVVVANKQKVAASLAFVSTNETDTRKVMAALKKAIDGK